ncbi:MAG: GDP-mannose 4,6-dehydratase [Thermodesulfovibrionia bacterium]|nr:GDP-mannose 4,6-dehydratase [Thermodesulfovibrionia bacterium]
MLRSLIIGITGCAGSHLAEFLLESGHNVFGTKRESDSLINVNDILGKIKVFNIDLSDKKNIINILRESEPDHIYFLASALGSESIKAITHTNVEGTLTFFDALAENPCRSRIVLTSSSAVYGIQKDKLKLSEDNKLFPSTHYGLSKVFQENIALYYNRNHGLDVVIARPFNFTGPRENPFLACTAFARQIVDIENNIKAPVISVGNLDDMRDFTDVRDTVKGLTLLAQKGRNGEIYNICSGTAYPIKFILDKLLSMSNEMIKVETSAKRIRIGEINIQTGDNSKIFYETGWKPLIPLDKTLEDILVYNRKKVDIK